MQHLLKKAPAVVLIFGLTLCWSAVVGGGFLLLLRYKATAGENGSVHSQWPEDSGIARVSGRFNLVVALHPHCPCSRATVAELEKILARSKDNVSIHALIYRPSANVEGWEESDIVRSVSRIPGVSIHFDEESAEARRFGAATSGHVLLFGPTGTLLFHGGVTASRGHQGETPAHEALWKLLGGEASALSSTPVFGCPLCNSKIER